MESEQDISAIQESDTYNPVAVEAASTRILANADITLPHPNEVPQVMNEAPAVSDDEDDKDFDINKSEITKTQVDADEAVEGEEVNNKNYFFGDSNERDGNEDDIPYVQRSTRVRHLPNKLIPNMEVVHVTYEEGAVKLQVEDMSKITMEVEKKNTIYDLIHACMLQLSLNDGLKIFYDKGKEDSQK